MINIRFGWKVYVRSSFGWKEKIVEIRDYFLSLINLKYITLLCLSLCAVISDGHSGDFNSDQVCEVYFDRHQPLPEQYSFKVAGALDQIKRPTASFDYDAVHRKVNEVARGLREGNLKVLIYAPNAKKIRDNALPLEDMMGPSPSEPRYSLIPIRENRKGKFLFKLGFIGLAWLSLEIANNPLPIGLLWVDTPELAKQIFQRIALFSGAFYFGERAFGMKNVARFPYIPNLADYAFFYRTKVKKQPESLLVENINTGSLSDQKVENNGDFLFQEFQNQEGRKIYIFYGLKDYDPRFDAPFQGKRSNNDEPFLYVIGSMPNDSDFSFFAPTNELLHPVTN